MKGSTQLEGETCVNRQCRVCGITKPINDFSPTGNGRGLCGRSHLCKPCKSEQTKARYNSAVKDRALEHRRVDRWRRAGELLSNARGRAKKYGLELTLTQEWIAERLKPGRCERTGLQFSLQRRSALAPSLDRRERTQGYTPENTQIVCWFYNRAKGTGSDEETRSLILAAAEVLA